MSADSVHIWSGQYKAYWRARGEGYTMSRAEAGQYTRAEAEAYTGHCGAEKRIRLIPVGEGNVEDGIPALSGPEDGSA